ncbi:1-(5-phosphoribosyl)-5-[(5-phosphoribosylamino) methylideneamino] imidazole-4-carboxamide isomerase [Acidimicrobiaceae bacterium]|nr:1-(5-phosphoribosyl)-5-[(5-phosphoribosylamino) methylideneamino] imidazole-4-carboxamide isomerase [Acidimicrobiaceae bacterium]
MNIRRNPIVVPCIDIQSGKVVQLIQGKTKALEGPDPLEMLEKFAGFEEIQVIDLDAAMGVGDNAPIIEMLASRAKCRVGGGVRTALRAQKLVDLGAHRVIVGTAAFTPEIQNIVDSVGRQKLVVALDSKSGKVVVDGWATTLNTTAQESLAQFSELCSGFLCTYVDKEGMMQGTDLDWFAQLRAATKLEITAAGGITTLDDVRALLAMDIDVAIGMAIYTGGLSLADLLRISSK